MRKHKQSTIRAERTNNKKTSSTGRRVLSSPNGLRAPRHSLTRTIRPLAPPSRRLGKQGLDTPATLSWHPRSKKDSGRHWALTHFLGVIPPSAWPLYSITGSSPRTPDMREWNATSLILLLLPTRTNHDATRTHSSPAPLSNIGMRHRRVRSSKCGSRALIIGGCVSLASPSGLPLRWTES